MSAVTTRNVCPYRVSATAEGPDVLVSILTMEGVHYSRALSPEDFGPWWHGFMAAVGDLSSGTVRVRQRDGLIVAFGHWAEDRWFDPRPEHERASDRKAERLATAALKYINAHRAKHAQRELDPVAAGWSDDDVFAEARRLGWADPLA